MAAGMRREGRRAGTKRGGEKVQQSVLGGEGRYIFATIMCNTGHEYTFGKTFSDFF